MSPSAIALTLSSAVQMWGAPSFPSDPAGKGREGGLDGHTALGAERKLNQIELWTELRVAAEKGLLPLRPREGPQWGFVGGTVNSAITWRHGL